MIYMCLFDVRFPDDDMKTETFRSLSGLFVKLFIITLALVHLLVSVPVAARSKAYVCGRSPAEFEASNLSGGMDVCLL